MVASSDAGVAELVGRVEAQLAREFDDQAGVDETGVGVAGVPFGGDGPAFTYGLLEGELTAHAVGGGDDVAREVVRADSNARSVLPFLGYRRVDVVAGVVGALTNREENVIADVEGPTSGGAFPWTPFDCRSDSELTVDWGSEAIEVCANFYVMADANDNSGSERGEGALVAGSVIEFAIDFALVENVRARDVEDGFLRPCPCGERRN